MRRRLRPYMAAAGNSSPASPSRPTFIAAAEELAAGGGAALLPRRRLGDWDSPAGAEALLGVVAGGVLFAATRRSELLGS